MYVYANYYLQFACYIGRIFAFYIHNSIDKYLVIFYTEKMKATIQLFESKFQYRT